MKITSFHPLILSKNGEELVKLFEALGFEKRHKIEKVDGNDVTNISMRDPNGFHVDVATSHNVPGDITTIRINVDNYDEAYDFLTARGFKSPEDHAVVSETSKARMLISPSGFAINLCQHIKD